MSVVDRKKLSWAVLRFGIEGGIFPRGDSGTIISAPAPQSPKPGASVATFAMAALTAT